MINYSLSFTGKADKDELTFINILRKNSEKYMLKISGKLYSVLSSLSKQPFIGRPATVDASIRVFIFNKQNKVVYKVEDKQHSNYPHLKHKNKSFFKILFCVSDRFLQIELIFSKQYFLPCLFIIKLLYSTSFACARRCWIVKGNTSVLR